MLRHVLDGIGIKEASDPQKLLHDALPQCQGPTCTLASSAKHRYERYGYACQDTTARNGIRLSLLYMRDFTDNE